MLSEKQMDEIKEHLGLAQNPLFLFDNDSDGICSFLLLQRYLGRGKGVAIKSFPSLTKDYLRKAEELKSDYIFVLDKAIISKEFFDYIHELNLPLIWIDHHEVQVQIPDFVNYYNPLHGDIKSEEPISFICYELTRRQMDQWIAIAGCIADKFIPPFYKEFSISYPDLAIESSDAFDILYNSKIGKISRIINFGLKDRVTNVVHMTKFLIKADSPYSVLEENKKNILMHKRFNEIDSKEKKLLQKALLVAKKSQNLLYFQYGGDLSISADLSNELNFLFPKKIVVVVYIRGTKGN